MIRDYLLFDWTIEITNDMFIDAGSLCPHTIDNSSKHSLNNTTNPRKKKSNKTKTKDNNKK